MSGVEDGKKIMSETQQALDDAGLGLDRALAKIEQLLEATKPISCIKGKEADGGTVDFVDVPDNQTQVKALDILLTLGNHYPPKELKAEVNHSGSIMAAVANILSKPMPAKTPGMDISKFTKPAKKAKPKTKPKAKKK
jgi:hypothetical protein